MTRAQAAVCAVATAFAFVAPDVSGKESAQLRRVPAAARAPVDPRPGARTETAPRAKHDPERRGSIVAGPGPGRAQVEPGRAKTAPAKPTIEPEAKRPRAAPASVEADAGRSASPEKTALLKVTREPEERAPTARARSGKAGTARASKPVKLRPVRLDPPNASWRPYRHEPWRRGYVSLFGHGKRWSGYIVGPGGDVPPLARKSLSETLSSWRTGKSMAIDERLIGLIADVSDEFGGRPIRIVSGYREHSFAPDSKHKVGQAFDFSIPGVPNEVLRDYLRSLPNVGVGFYPNSTHVHLDVRERPTYWVDYSRPGEHPLYSYEKRVAGLTPAERALAAALDAIGLPGDSGDERPDTGKLGGMAKAPPAVGERRARTAEVPLSKAATPAEEPNGVRRVAPARLTPDDAGEEEQEPAAADAGQSGAPALEAPPRSPEWLEGH